MKPRSRYLIIIILLYSYSQLQAQILSSDNEEISIYLGWEHQFQFAGYYAAIEQGYFNDHNLDVTLVPKTDDLATEAVAKGKFDYGIATGAALLGSDQFEELSVVAAIMQQSPVSLIGLKSQGVNSLLDLNGADIVGGTEVTAMLISAGVDLNSVRFHGRSSSFDNLINGKFKAMTYFITDKTKLLGNDSLLFNIFRPIEYGINFYGECLFTSREEVINNPERIRNIREAVIRGWEYVIEHPQETIELIKTKYNTARTKEELSNEAQTIIHTLILPRFYDVGDMQKSKWQEMSNFMHEHGLFHKKRDVERFIYISPENINNDINRILAISGLIIALIGSVALLLLLYNYQLKRAVRLRTKALEKTNQELDRFVYSISHDIRSPLSSILGLITLMSIDPKAKDEYLDLIKTSIIKLDDFTKDILDYTRNSRTKVKSEPIELDTLIEKCISQIAFDNEYQDLRIEKDMLIEEPIVSDIWRLEIIINNLLTNSIRYRDENKKDPFIKIGANTNSDGVAIYVEDNGIGINIEHHNKIFDMFYRASENSQGSGLGLYIVKETVNLIGGSVSIESEVKVGTRVEIKLPK